MRLMTLAALGAAFLLAGCGLTETGDTLRQGAAIKGREAAAGAVENAEWLLCRALPVGAIKDRYGRSADMAEAYSRLCGAGGEGLSEIMHSEIE